MERTEHVWSERRSTTLRDVARSVGVSESTASVVLNRTRSGTRVSAETRRHVLEAAERLGYRPNALARSLQKGSTQRIGVYSGRAHLDSRNLFFADLLGGICEGAREHEFNTVIHTSGNGPSMLLDLLSNRALDGLVVHARQDDPILGMLDELRVPAVAIADQVSAIPTICVDDDGGGRMQAQHLAQLGHRNVLYKQTLFTARSAVNRMESFLRTATELGMNVTIHNETTGDDSLSSEDFDLLNRTTDRVTAIVGCNDRVAEVCCHGLSAVGMSIPKDVAVVGFDGFNRFYAPRFELTTIRAPWSQLGARAISTLMSLIAGECVPGVTILPIEFVRGATT
ncbi:LacI family DNA-binding transcriptional regulator [Fimbriimonas ginsengisoli]|uniref:LacI family DNA-binding transcriptional regulator n=1 Tax=Fimbriimonas ginsengisoli TaxID=1005039 RepID=UPI0003E932AA|nr:LacI family DNA-binding transcriptional regulator [Fimbriimonas ginsengisoli]